MSIWSFIFGEKAEPQKKPVLGLQQAEEIYTQASDGIKNDSAKAVPFAIIATAQALGADVTVCDECSRVVSNIETSVASTQNHVIEERKKSDARINELQAQIEKEIRSIEHTKKYAATKIAELETRKNEVSKIADFFTLEQAEK